MNGLISANHRRAAGIDCTGTNADEMNVSGKTAMKPSELADSAEETTCRAARCAAIGPHPLRALPATDPAAFVAAAIKDAPARFQARVTLHAPAAEIAARRYLWGAAEPLDQDSCEYRTSDDSLDWLALRIGMLGVDFEVHEPPELVERFELLAERFAGAVAGPRRPASR